MPTSTPTPVVNPLQSVLGYLQHQKFEFQPYATNNPTWWTCSALPQGISMDPTTGLISGAATWPGVYVFSVQATATPVVAATQSVLAIVAYNIGEGGSYSLNAYNATGGNISIIVPGPAPTCQTLHVASVGDIGDGGYNLTAYTPSGATLAVTIAAGTSVADAMRAFAAAVAAAPDDWTWTPGADNASGTIACKHSGAPSAGPVLNSVTIPPGTDGATQGWQTVITVLGGAATTPANYIVQAIQDAVAMTPSFSWTADPALGPNAGYLRCLVPGPTTAPVVSAVNTATRTTYVPGYGVRPPASPVWSAACVFTMGIEASSDDLTSDLTATLDLDTRELAFDNLAAPDSSATTVQPLFSAKRGDTLVLTLRFVKSGTVCDLSLASLKFGLKEVDPDNLILETTTWAKTGSGTDARYRIPITFTGDAMESTLSNYEGDQATYFAALGEIEWVENAATPIPAGFPATMRGSSKTFFVGVIRDLIPDA